MWNMKKLNSEPPGLVLWISFLVAQSIYQAFLSISLLDSPPFFIPSTRPYKGSLLPCRNQFPPFPWHCFILSTNQIASEMGKWLQDWTFSACLILGFINICQINDWLDFVSCSFHYIH